MANPEHLDRLLQRVKAAIEQVHPVPQPETIDVEIEATEPERS
jgi:hypothetical protein